MSQGYLMLTKCEFCHGSQHKLTKPHYARKLLSLSTVAVLSIPCHNLTKLSHYHRSAPPTDEAEVSLGVLRAQVSDESFKIIQYSRMAWDWLGCMLFLKG